MMPIKIITVGLTTTIRLLQRKHRISCSCCRLGGLEFYEFQQFAFKQDSSPMFTQLLREWLGLDLGNLLEP